LLEKKFKKKKKKKAGLDKIHMNGEIITGIVLCMYGDLISLKTLASEVLSALCLISAQAHGCAIYFS